MKNYFQSTRKRFDSYLKGKGVLGEILTTDITPKGLTSLLTAGMITYPSVYALAQETATEPSQKTLTEEKGNQIIVDNQSLLDQATQSLEYFATLKYIKLGKKTFAQLDSLGYQSVKTSVGITEALNAGLLESVEELVRTYADGRISQEEAKEASRFNYFRPNPRLIQGLRNISEQIAEQVAAASAANPKLDYTKDRNELKKLENVIATIEGTINSEIDPLSSELEQAFKQYNQTAPQTLASAAVKHAQGTAWYNTLGLDKDLSKKGIAKKLAWVGVGTGLYFLGRELAGGEEKVFNTGKFHNNTY